MDKWTEARRRICVGRERVVTFTHTSAHALREEQQHRICQLSSHIQMFAAYTT
jgi:hypothetical protein